MTWSDVLRSVFVLPLTAGNPKGNQRRLLDGGTSTLVFNTFLLSFILLAKAITGPTETRSNFFGFHVILSIIALTGLLSYVTMMIVLKRRGVSRLLEPKSERNTSNIHIGFLWISGIASVVFCSLKIGRLVECEISLLEQSTALNISLAECVYYIVMDLFLIIQMIFLTYLKPFQFKNSLTLQYWILMIISTNLTICAYGFRDSGDEYEHIANNTWIALSCTNQTFTHLLGVSEKILTPTFLEFSFLAITLVQNVTPSRGTTNKRENDELVAVTVDRDTEESDTNSFVFNQRTALLDNSNASVGFKPPLFFYVNALCSCTIGVAVLIMYLVKITSKGNDQSTQNARDVCEAVASSMLVIYVHTGYYLLSKHTEPSTFRVPISGSEYIFIISSIGSLFSCTFSVLSFSHFALPYYKVHVASRVIIGLISYTQTVLILHAKRCKRKHANENMSSLRSVLLLLAMYNFVFWIIESFVYGRFYAVKDIERKYLGPDLWNIRMSICHPLYMYFSFTSALETYNLFKKFG